VNKLPAPVSSIWQLSANTAKFHTSQLSGQIDLQNPLRGLHKLTCGATAVEGSVFGVATSGTSVAEDSIMEEALVRGDDLVATYRAADERPFSLQVYWTVRQRKNGVVIDVLLSLETPLLESFPSVLMKSELQSVEVLQPQQGREFLVLRSVDKDWSYAEMAHPQDSGDLRIDEKGVVQRTLGGTFLEKGVVRRLRFRGVFLPRANDLELASECLAELAAETPPLTT